MSRRTARERLTYALTTHVCTCGSSDACPTPEQLVDAYAHQLAEQIRAEVQQLKADQVLEPDKDWTASGAADLIDPEAQP